MNDRATRKDDHDRLQESVRRALELVGPDESAYDDVSKERITPAA